MMHSTRALATQSQHVLAGLRNSKSNSSRPLSSLKFDNQLPRSPQLELELAQLNRAPTRRVRYLPELDMEIEIVEPPRKAVVNKDIRVRALREHWDEKESQSTHRHSSEPKPSSPLRFELSKLRRD